MTTISAEVFAALQQRLADLENAATATDQHNAASGAVAAALPPPAYRVVSDKAAPPQRLDLTTDRGDAWHTWKVRWDDYVMLTDLTKASSAIQMAKLRSCLSDDTLRVVRSFELPEGQDTMVNILKRLEEYAKGQVNEVIERRHFNSRAQQEGETLDDYLVALKELATTCNFCTNCRDSLMRDRLVIGLRDAATIQKLCAIPKLSLHQAIEICRAEEAANRDVATIVGPLTATFRVQHPPRGAARKRSTGSTGDAAACPRCGRQHTSPDTCPAKGKECLTCRKTGHFASVCRSGRKTKQNMMKPLTAAVIASMSQGGAPRVRVQVSVGTGEPVSCTALPDSGADITVAGTDFLQLIGGDTQNLLPPRESPQAADGRRIKAYGVLPATVVYGDGEVGDIIHVLHGVSGLLLSWKTARGLQILPRDYPAPQVPARTTLRADNPLTAVASTARVLSAAAASTAAATASSARAAGAPPEFADPLPAPPAREGTAAPPLEPEAATAIQARSDAAERPARADEAGPQSRVDAVERSTRATATAHPVRRPTATSTASAVATPSTSSSTHPAGPSTSAKAAITAPRVTPTSTASSRRAATDAATRPATPPATASARGAVAADRRATRAPTPGGPSSLATKKAPERGSAVERQAARAKRAVSALPPTTDGLTAPRAAGAAPPLPPASQESDAAALPPDDIFSEFSDVFDGVIKVMPGEQYKICLRDDAVPFAVTAPRRVPFALREPLQQELRKLEDNGIIVPVTEPTDWCAPIVVTPKKSGEGIRLCVDLSRLNRSVRRELYQSNTPAECVASIAAEEAKFFAVFDALKGYHQCPLEPQSQPLTTFTTPFGRYMYLRAPYGVSSISEHYNRRMDQCFASLPGIQRLVDDVIV